MSAGVSRYTVGPPTPFSPLWLGFPQESSGVDVVLDLGASAPPVLTWLAVHVLLVSPVWFVDGSASSPVTRNVTSQLPASVTFRAAAELPPMDAGESLAGAQWMDCGSPIPARPWSGKWRMEPQEAYPRTMSLELGDLCAAPTDFDIRTELYEVGGPGNVATLCTGRFLWAHVAPPAGTATGADTDAAAVSAFFLDEIIVNPQGL